MSVSFISEIATKDVNVIQQIAECTNTAFLVDAFFKKPTHILRFTNDDVDRMMDNKDSVFIVTRESKQSNFIMASLYLDWEIKTISKHEIHIVGHVSAVSVLPQYEKRGVGKQILQTAEDYLKNYVTKSVIQKKEQLSINDTANNNDNTNNTDNNSCFNNMKIITINEICVVNMRYDLFPWYEKQGYFKVHEIRPNEPAFAVKIKESMKDEVCLVLMRKIISTTDNNNNNNSNNTSSRSSIDDTTTKQD